MSETPFARAAALRVGTVDFVAPDEVKVVLDIEAPDSVALNTGTVRSFPRVNGYILVPVDSGFLIAQVEWLTVERSAFPQRRGVRDFGLVDLPYPLRRMSANPVGTLRKKPGPAEAYSFARGASALPSVGAPVLLPTDQQLRAIVESAQKGRVTLGTSPLAAGAQVRVDPDRMFGRHLAVLGNTGSGKSCSVAGLIRWSLEAAKNARGNGRPNARFIVLDPNGEYSRAFADVDDAGLRARIFKVDPGPEASALRVPLWFWNSAEWASFTQASPRAQRPALVHALRSVRDNALDVTPSVTHAVRRLLRTMLATLIMERNSGAPWGTFPKNKAFFQKLEKWQTSLEARLASVSGQEHASLKTVVDDVEQLCAARRARFDFDFTEAEVNDLIRVMTAAHAVFGGLDHDADLLDSDCPLPFTGDALVRGLEATAEMMNVTEYVETLLIRIRGLLADGRLQAIVGDEDGVTLAHWLGDYVGGPDAANGEVAIIDLALVPSEVVHVVTAVVARMAFESLQRYRKLKGCVLPTVLVIEEAHTFVRRYAHQENGPDATAVCCQVFERIAREGRKFGLGLVLSSQRPSELSPTVLSQCNTFLLHRISNDRDQELVGRLIPDNLRAVLRELPSLPSQHAVLLGWASELPMLVRMRDLPKCQRPLSDDPDFWDVWRGKNDDGEVVLRPVDWESIAQDWQGRS